MFGPQLPGFFKSWFYLAVGCVAISYLIVVALLPEPRPLGELQFTCLVSGGFILAVLMLFGPRRK